MVHSQNLNLANHDPRRIIKLTKIVLKILVLQTNFPVKTRDIHKIVKQYRIIKKNIQSMYQKNIVKENMLI